MDAGDAGAHLMFPRVSSELKQGVARAADDILDAREALAPRCYESRGADEGKVRALFDI
jgi:hypothetical protein